MDREQAMRDLIARIAVIAENVALQAGVGGIEMAGMIVSYLAKHPDRLESILTNGICDEPAELWAQGRLTWMGKDGRVFSPQDARLRRIVKSMEPPK
jgi:hypothetical protein